MRYAWLSIVLVACGTSGAGSVDGDPGPANQLASISWQTQHTLLRATGLEIAAAGQTFTAAAANVSVSGDYVEADGYTTLESIWQEHGVEMRLFIYLYTDGVSWWANEIRHYNGSSPGDWAYDDGDFFRSPVGMPFTGDFAVGDVQLKQLFMTSFLEPTCGSASYTIDPYGLLVELSTDPNTGYRMPIYLRDATCAAIAAPAGATFAWTTDDPGVATVVAAEDSTFTSAGDFKGITPGNTMATVTLSDAAGSALAQQRIPVVVDVPAP